MSLVCYDGAVLVVLADWCLHVCNSIMMTVNNQQGS